jgi:hypothetical protein
LGYKVLQLEMLHGGWTSYLKQEKLAQAARTTLGSLTNLLQLLLLVKSVSVLP